MKKQKIKLDLIYLVIILVAGLIDVIFFDKYLNIIIGMIVGFIVVNILCTKDLLYIIMDSYSRYNSVVNLMTYTIIILILFAFLKIDLLIGFGIIVITYRMLFYAILGRSDVFDK